MIGRCLVLLVVAAGASASSAVYVASAKVFTGTLMANLPARCRTDAPVHACTTFERPFLTTHCRKEGAWLMDATLQLAPTIILTRTDFLAHEMTHLNDIEARLEKHLRLLVSPRFATREQCLQAAGAAIYALPAVFERVKGESNLALDRARNPGRILASAQ